MRVTASEFHLYFQPEPCDTRVYLRSNNAEGRELSPYAQVLIELGLRFEKKYLASFETKLDLSGQLREQREQLTKSAVHNKEAVIYQPAFSAKIRLDSFDVEIVGDPDFLVLENGSYVIRDVKLARRISEKDHPEILRQLELYGWLFQQTFGTSPRRLEVYSSSGEFTSVAYDGGARALGEIEKIIRLKTLAEAPYSPVGWSKCSPCKYKDLCWSAAENRRDVALVYGVDQNLARALRSQGIETYDQLVEKFNVVSLADFKRPWGAKTQRVGKAAGQILSMADALKAKKETILSAPQLPKSEHFVMFDLEGMPPQMDELQKIYIWGLQVFGKTQGPFLASAAGCGLDGDREGWNKFLKNVEKIFGEHGEIPLIHWHHYEKTNVENYIERFGDPFGIADRVLVNMIDILPLVKSSLALPIPSYSLKAIEKYIGFQRSQTEFGGDWAIAKYIEATETDDEEIRRKILDEILTYNREDLAATWTVFDWFRKKFSDSTQEKTG